MMPTIIFLLLPQSSIVVNEEKNNI